MSVVVAVMRSPPNGALLSSSRAEHSQAKLKEATGLVRAVREIPVVYSGDGEHANYVQSKAYSYSYPTNANPDGRDAGYMNRPKRTLLNEVDPVEVVFYDCVTVVHDCFS